MLYRKHKANSLNRLLIPLLAGALIVVAPTIHARTTYVSTWTGLYPGSSSYDNASCALCHGTTSGSGSNAYGDDIRAITSGTLAERYQAVEGLDSDSDPTSSDNLTEINASAQPGWTGSAPTGVIGDLDPVVANLPPVANANGPYFGTAEQQVLFNGSGSDDPDGTITAYDWAFGDGNTGTGVSPTHTYTAAGTYDVSLVVTDNDGDSSAPSNTTASIEPAPQDPVANPNGPYVGIENQPVIFDGSGSFDPDGGVITQYDWDFGDGNTGIGVSPSHSYDVASSYTVTLSVVDDEGAQSATVSTTADIAFDQDGDGTPDNLDNCVLVANGPLVPDAGGNIQLDTNGDGYGNICDPDLNNDLIVNAADLALFKPLFFTADPDADFDGDGIVNAADLAIMKTMFFKSPGPSGLVP